VTDDGNDIAMIGMDDHATSAERDSGKLMVVNAGDMIHMTVRVCLHDAHLGSNNAAVSTTVHKAIIHGGTFGMNSVTECVELKMVGGATFAIRRFAQQKIDRTRRMLVVRGNCRATSEGVDNQIVWLWWWSLSSGISTMLLLISVRWA